MALGLFGPLANAQPILASECHAPVQGEGDFTLRIPKGKIDVGYPVDIQSGSGKIGEYIVINIYFPSFGEVSYELAYGGGYSHGVIRLTEDRFKRQQFRLQKFEGEATFEGNLDCK